MTDETCDVPRFDGTEAGTVVLGLRLPEIEWKLERMDGESWEEQLRRDRLRRDIEELKERVGQLQERLERLESETDEPSED